MSFRSFAIVPAAGRSERMGRPKLLLPWGEVTILEAVLSAWRSGGVDRIIVTVHRDDVAIAELCRASGADVVVPAIAPPDMKSSVLAGLKHVANHYSPGNEDAWFVAPADLPNLSADLIARLLKEHAASPERILVPLYAGRRGHPALFPWRWAARVANLPENVGLNALLTGGDVCEIFCELLEAEADIDTPDDYERWKNRYNR